MDVHYRFSNEPVAPCGYRYQARQYGLDFSRVAFRTPTSHIAVSCRDCLHWMAARKGPRRVELGRSNGLPWARKSRF